MLMLCIHVCSLSMICLCMPVSYIYGWILPCSVSHAAQFCPLSSFNRVELQEEREQNWAVWKMEWGGHPSCATQQRFFSLPIAAFMPHFSPQNCAGKRASANLRRSMVGLEIDVGVRGFYNHLSLPKPLALPAHHGCNVPAMLGEGRINK